MRLSLEQNPVNWYEKERYGKSMVPHVERLKFEQVYDYALWLEKELERTTNLLEIEEGIVDNLREQWPD